LHSLSIERSRALLYTIGEHVDDCIIEADDDGIDDDRRKIEAGDNSIDDSKDLKEIIRQRRYFVSTRLNVKLNRIYFAKPHIQINSIQFNV